MRRTGKPLDHEPRGRNSDEPDKHGQGPLGRSNDSERTVDGRGRPDSGRPDAPGRSESSPGHLKKAGGATSARDYAPGHAPARAGIADVAPDEIGDGS